MLSGPVAARTMTDPVPRPLEAPTVAGTRIRLNGLAEDVNTLTYVGVELPVKAGVVTVPDDADPGFLGAFLRDNPDHELVGDTAKAKATADQAAATE